MNLIFFNRKKSVYMASVYINEDAIFVHEIYLQHSQLYSPHFQLIIYKFICYYIIFIQKLNKKAPRKCLSNSLAACASPATNGWVYFTLFKPTYTHAPIVFIIFSYRAHKQCCAYLQEIRFCPQTRLKAPPPQFGCRLFALFTLGPR